MNVRVTCYRTAPTLRHGAPARPEVYAFFDAAPNGETELPSLDVMLQRTVVRDDAAPGCFEYMCVDEPHADATVGAIYRNARSWAGHRNATLDFRVAEAPARSRAES